MTNESATELFIVVDMRTGAQVGKPYTSRSRARSSADKLDNTYGAYRYTVRTYTK